MALNDIYQVKITTNLLAQEEALNVFYYQVTSGAGDAGDLDNEIQAVLLTDWEDILEDSVTLSRVQIVNGMDNSDFSDESISISGNVLGSTPAPPQICASFRSPSGGPGTRYSYKRIGGIAQNAINTSDGSFSAAFKTLANPLSTELGSVLEGASGSYTPAQITGPFVLGISPTFARLVTGQWSLNEWPGNQVTRSAHTWVLPV